MGVVLHPVFLIAAVTIVGSTVCIGQACFASRPRNRILLIVAAVIFLMPSGLLIVMLKPELVDARFATYKRFYRDIDLGMTRTQVMELLEQHYPPEGDRLPPMLMQDSEERLDFFMNPENSSQPNCEGIFLHMRADKVAEKVYSPD